jgi:hypothetical protein
MTALPVRSHPLLSALALALLATAPLGLTQAQGFSAVPAATPNVAAATATPGNAVPAAATTPPATASATAVPSVSVPITADDVPVLANATPPPLPFGGSLAAASPVVPSHPANAGAVAPPTPTPATAVPSPVAPAGAASTTFSSGSGSFSSVSGGAPALPAPPTNATFGAGSSSSFEMADKVLVIKHERVLRLLRRGRVVAEYPIKLGLNPYGHKQRAGDFRTPEGKYDLVARNPQSDFYLSIKVSYPNREDAAVANESGYEPGGLIMIHGQPNVPKRPPEHYATRDWTDGCIALSNADMADVWLRTTVGIPIEIRP